MLLDLPFEDTESDDEWITKEGDDIFDEGNVQVEQLLGESGSGSNSDLVGGSLSDPTLDTFDIDNLVLNDNVKDHFSNEKDFEDDGSGGDIGDDLIRELMDM